MKKWILCVGLTLLLLCNLFAAQLAVSAEEGYILWLGETQVTADNCADIFGDGTASFDPDTNTLTLNNPTISGYHTGFNSNYFGIYAENMDLTIAGSFDIVKRALYIETLFLEDMLYRIILHRGYLNVTIQNTFRCLFRKVFAV